MKNDNFLYENKEKLIELRKMKQEIENSITDIQNLRTVCYAMNEHIRYEGDKIKALKSEIAFRTENLNDINKQCESLANPLQDNNSAIEKFKEGLIKKKMTELLYELIPEVNPNQSGAEDGDISEYNNLMFDHVQVIFTIYDLNHITKYKENRQKFRLSKKSTFKILKFTACNFWDIQNHIEYEITDEAEGLIYQADMNINDFFRDYSPTTNILRLMSLSTIKARSKFLPVQEIRMKESNKLNIKEKKKRKPKFEYSTNDITSHRINNFLNDHPSLKSHVLREDNSESDEEIGQDIDPDKKVVELKDYEGGFSMMVILFLMLITTFIFVYNTRDINLENIKKDHLRKLFDNNYVEDYRTLFKYLSYNIAFNFKSNTTYKPDKLMQDFIFPNETLIKDDDILYYKSLVEDIEYIFKDLKMIHRVKDNDIYPKIDISQTIDDVISYRESLHFIFASSIKLIINKVKQSNCSQDENVKEILDPYSVCYAEVYDKNTVDKSQINVLFRKVSFKTAEEENVTIKVDNL
jgi:hypothetical protein